MQPHIHWEPAYFFVSILFFWLGTAKLIEEVLRILEGPKYIPIGPNYMDVIDDFRSMLTAVPDPVRKNIEVGVQNGISWTWRFFRAGYEVGYGNALDVVDYINLPAEYCPALRPYIPEQGEPK